MQYLRVVLSFPTVKIDHAVWSSHITVYQLTKLWLTYLFFLIADLKLHLQGTDYGSFLANEASPLSVSVIDDKLKEKLVVEFQHLRNQAMEPLSTFLDYVTYVENVDELIVHTNSVIYDLICALKHVTFVLFIFYILGTAI